MKTAIRFQLNGQAVTQDTDDERMLLWVLRTELGLTGTKHGCGDALCCAGIATVLDKAVRT
jgi:aerobic-type carbon monoxide dehydrogenase small subunit (CoxS/CutS family)